MWGKGCEGAYEVEFPADVCKGSGGGLEVYEVGKGDGGDGEADSFCADVVWE